MVSIMLKKAFQRQGKNCKISTAMNGQLSESPNAKTVSSILASGILFFAKISRIFSQILRPWPNA